MSDPVLREGNQGAAVRRLTGLLKQRGFYSRSQSEFDRPVRNAVKEFQSRHLDSRGRPLVADGVVGPLTWWALQHADNSGLFGEPAAGLAVPTAGGTERGRAALATAIGEIAVGACEQGANNCGAFVEKYLNGIVPTPANWCAGFVSWCFSRHPDGCPWPYSLGARDIREKFRRRGWLYDVSLDAPPQPGDVIFWWREQPDGWMGHVGLVHEFRDGIVYTIEGNKGGFPAPVHRYDYVLGRIDKLLGFGRVP